MAVSKEIVRYLDFLAHLREDWKSAHGIWPHIKEYVDSGGGMVLDDLTDVNAPSPNDDDVLAWNDIAGEWQPVAPSGGPGGPADRVIVEVTQTSHGFAVGDVIRATSADTYAKAQADTAANAEVIGVVSEVDGDNFTYIALGVYDYAAGVPVASVGTALFLSDATPGLLTATEPTTVGHVSKPVAVMVVSDTKMVIFPLRGVVIGSGGSAGADNFLDLTDTPNSYEAFGYGLVRVNEDEDMLEFSAPHESKTIVPILPPFPPPDWATGQLDGQLVNSVVGTWEKITASGVVVDTISGEKVISMLQSHGQRTSKLYTADDAFLDRWMVHDGMISFEFKTNLGTTSSGYVNIGLNSGGWLLGFGVEGGYLRIGVSGVTAYPEWPDPGDWEASRDIDLDSGADWHSFRLAVRHPYLQMFIDDQGYDAYSMLVYCYAGPIDNTNDFIEYLGLYSMMHLGGSGEYFYIRNLTILNRDYVLEAGRSVPAA